MAPVFVPVAQIIDLLLLSKGRKGVTVGLLGFYIALTRETNQSYRPV